VLSPDIIWNIVLNEIAKTIIKHGKRYQKLFTNNDSKIVLTMGVSEQSQFSLTALLKLLETHVPVDIDMFFPSFSTTTDESRFANLSVFAMSMTIYYNYETTLCGLPRVRLEGTSDDYRKILDHLQCIRDTVYPYDSHEKFRDTDEMNYSSVRKYRGDISNYIDRVVPHINNIMNCFNQTSEKNAKLFKAFYSIGRCESGHPFGNGEGWLFDFFEVYSNLKTIQWQNDAYTDAPNHIGIVPWHNDISGKDFHLASGLLYSK
jgi:hypothetical protein